MAQIEPDPESSGDLLLPDFAECKHLAGYVCVGKPIKLHKVTPSMAMAKLVAMFKNSLCLKGSVQLHALYPTWPRLVESREGKR